MPAITRTSVRGFGTIDVTETTLDGATDSFVYKARDILTLRNPTAGALTPNIDGAGGDTVDSEGLGEVDVSGGFAVGSIGVGEAKAIRLDSIKGYLRGVIAITGGTGLVATLYQP